MSCRRASQPVPTRISSCIARQLIGLPRHLSIHPGGIVIAPGRLTRSGTYPVGKQRGCDYSIRPGFD